MRNSRRSVKRQARRSTRREADVGPIPPQPPVGEVYWSYPLLSDGVDTVSGDVMFNTNPDAREIPVAAGAYINPANTLAIRPDHDYYGKSFEGLLASPEAGAIATDKIQFPTAGKPTVGVTFEFDFVMLEDDTNEIFHIEWANAPLDTYVSRSFNNLEFTHGPDTIAIPYANLISLGQLYKGHVSVTEDFLIGGLNGFEVIRENRTGGQEAVWADKGFIGGFNEVLSSIIVKGFVMKKYEALPPPLAERVIAWDFTNPDIAIAAVDTVNGISVEESDSTNGILIEQTNLDMVIPFGNGEVPFDAGIGLVNYSASRNLMNNSEMTICPDQSVSPAVINWVGRQITGVDTDWEVSPLLTRGVLFNDTALVPFGCEFDSGDLIVGNTYVISFFLKMNDGSVPVGQVWIPDGDFYNKDNTFQWSQTPNNLSDQLIKEVGNSSVYRCQCPFVYSGGLVGIQQNVTQIAGAKSGFVVTGFQLEDRGANPTDLQRASRYMPTEPTVTGSREEYAVQANVSNPAILPNGNFTAVTEFTLLNSSVTNVEVEPEKERFATIAFMSFDQEIAVCGYTTKYGPNADGIEDYTYYFGLLSSESSVFVASTKLSQPAQAGDRLRIMMYSRDGLYTIIVANMTTGETVTGSGVSAQGTIEAPLNVVAFGDSFFFRTLPRVTHTFDIRQYTVPPIPQRIPINALLDDDGEYIMVDGDYLTTG